MSFLLLFRLFLPLVVHTATALAAVAGTRTTTGRAIRTTATTTIATAQIGTIAIILLMFLHPTLVLTPPFAPAPAVAST